MKFTQLEMLRPKYLKAAVYGANDGIITTFAVVAGVAGAGLSSKIIIILGIANMIADGLSMGIGDFLGAQSEERLKHQQTGKSSHRGIWKTGAITFVSFVIAGTFPLLPYFLRALGLPIPSDSQFTISILATGAILFIIGSARTIFTKGSWIKSGLEMLVVGAIAATAAFFLGAWVEGVVNG